MEITRTPAIAGIASQNRGAATVQQHTAPIQPTAKAQVRQAETRRQISEALAREILKESNLPPVEFHKFNVRLDIHKETGRVVAEIENKQTGEVLQKIPSDSLLRSAMMLEQFLGTILDRPA